MSRACVIYERTGDGGWRPVILFYATPKAVDYKVLPGDVKHEAWAQAVIAQGQPPVINYETYERGTWEDWISWAADAFATGYSWASEVEPEVTMQATYEREILGYEPRPLTPPALQPTTMMPELSGYKKVRPL